MPRGKNAAYRYRLIDQALRNTARRWSWEGLLKYVCEKLEEEFDVNLGGEKERAVSPRQLADDIRIMRKSPPEGFGAPIIRKDGYIYYEDPGFSINDNPLISTDIESLNEILRLIRPYRSLPHLRELETIIGKVQGTISRNSGDQAIELEHNPNVKGLQHIESLYSLIRNGYVAHVDYQPFGRDLADRYLLHPYLIKEYNNRWFLLGWLPESDKFMVFPLDRIFAVVPTHERADMARKEELVRRQREIIGVTLIEGNEPVEVRLWFSREQLPYLLTKPLHPSQRLEREDAGGGLVSLRLALNFELEQALLMFGDRVRVLEPPSLANRIRDRLVKAAGAYQE